MTIINVGLHSSDCHVNRKMRIWIFSVCAPVRPPPHPELQTTSHYIVNDWCQDNILNANIPDAIYTMHFDFFSFNNPTTISSRYYTYVLTYLMAMPQWPVGLMKQSQPNMGLNHYLPLFFLGGGAQTEKIQSLKVSLVH